MQVTDGTPVEVVTTFTPRVITLENAGEVEDVKRILALGAQFENEIQGKALANAIASAL